MSSTDCPTAALLLHHVVDRMPYSSSSTTANKHQSIPYGLFGDEDILPRLHAYLVLMYTFHMSPGQPRIAPWKTFRCDQISMLSGCQWLPSPKPPIEIQACHITGLVGETEPRPLPEDFAMWGLFTQNWFSPGRFDHGTLTRKDGCLSPWQSAKVGQRDFGARDIHPTHMRRLRLDFGNDFLSSLSLVEALVLSITCVSAASIEPIRRQAQRPFEMPFLRRREASLTGHYTLTLPEPHQPPLHNHHLAKR
ncbi:hypothetical protein J3F83DRAFT_133430 [Trichoderma novae-zelandiae]